VHDRRVLLDRLAGLVDAEGEGLAATICAEVGKTITEARNEARRAVGTLRLSSEAAAFPDGEVLSCAILAGGADRHAVVTYRPTGVVAAADTAIGHRYEIAGQSCAAVKWPFVHDDIRTRFTELLLDRVARLRWGDPAQEATQMGPVIDRTAAAGILDRLAQAQAMGARLLAGGTRDGALVAPTVIDDVPPDAPLIAEETSAAMSASSRMSQRMNATCSPAIAWPAASAMSATITRTPAATNASTTARPILVAPPGTMATLPCNPRIPLPRCLKFQ